MNLVGYMVELKARHWISGDGIRVFTEVVQSFSQEPEKQPKVVGNSYSAGEMISSAQTSKARISRWPFTTCAFL